MLTFLFGAVEVWRETNACFWPEVAEYLPLHQLFAEGLSLRMKDCNGPPAVLMVLGCAGLQTGFLSALEQTGGES